MTFVERLYHSFIWGRPLHGRELRVRVVGTKLEISGLFPNYKTQDRPTDLVFQYEKARKYWGIGKQRNGKASPHVAFSNADTDEKLISFVRRFGPIVAESVHLSDYEEGKATLLTAVQDLAELRRERSIYRSALALVVELDRSRLKPETFDDGIARDAINNISANVSHWQDQWYREGSARGSAPLWRPSVPSMSRIAALAVPLQKLRHRPPVSALPPNVDAHVVICELLNIFPSLVFPNPLELHASLRYGIRPLLYSILRRELLQAHETAVCANTRCREFFEIERARQMFCNEDCSRQQRQREYWQKRGRKLRSKRLKQNSRNSG
jgi:hypothetical protein